MAALSDDDTRQRYGLAPDAAVRRQRLGADSVVRLDPDSFTVAQVASALESSVWDRPVVVAGGTVWLTVQGSFVGEGAPVEITLKDARNRTVGRGRAPMHRDQAIVEVAVDRQAAERDRDGVLAAADIEIQDLGLKSVSAPILVLPFAELVDAAWDAPEARDGDDVGLTCRVTGSHAGVERLEGRTAEVEILRGDEGDDAVFEPVVTLRAPVASGKVSVRWRVGFDAEGKAQIATQPEYDAAAERTGAKAERYARPAYRFRVTVGGLGADSPALGYRDHVDLAWDAGTERPAAGAPVTVHLADGTTQELTLGDDGRQRLTDVPPGPVEAFFGPDPRPYEREPGVGSQWRDDLPTLDLPVDISPAPTFGAGSPMLAMLASGLSGLVLPPALLASLAGDDPETDDEGILEWFWGTLIGDFNENASYDQIAANIGASFVPIVGQAMDLRDIVAGLYLLSKDQGWRDWLKWLGLIATLVGVVPVFGDLVKGAFRIVLRSMRNIPGQGVDVAARVLREAFERSRISGDLGRWVDNLDLGQLVERATVALRWAGDYLREMFEWAARQADTGTARFAENVGQAVSRVKLETVNLFRSWTGRAPVVTGSMVSVAARLRGAAQQVEQLQMMANARIARGIDELYDALRELVGLGPRPRGTGVSGGVVTPGGSSGGRPRPPGLEAGAVNRPYRANGLPEVAKVHPGWPDLPPGDATTFVRAVPVELPPGTRIYRVIEDSRYPDGSFWAYDLPGSRGDWRNRYAVKDGWSQNGYYVEYVVPPHAPLRIWSGPAAEQSANASGWTLPGGAEQIWMPRGHVTPSPQHPTGW